MKPVLRNDLTLQFKQFLPYEITEHEEVCVVKSPMVFPSQEELRQLLSLAESGFLDDVAEVVSELATENHAFDLFAQEVQRKTR